MSLHKQVIRFALRVTLVRVECPTLALEGACQVHVDWKRGKHHGQSGPATLKGGQAAWSAPDIVIPCTMYLKKKVFEDKALTLALVRLGDANRPQTLGRVTVQIDQLATDMGDADERAWTRSEKLENDSRLVFEVGLRRLQPGGGSATLSVTPPPKRSSAVTAAPSGRDAQRAASPPPLSESPLQALESSAAKPDAAPGAPTPVPSSGVRRPVPALSSLDRGAVGSAPSTMAGAPSQSSSSSGIEPIPVPRSPGGRGPASARSSTRNGTPQSTPGMVRATTGSRTSQLAGSSVTHASSSMSAADMYQPSPLPGRSDSEDHDTAMARNSPLLRSSEADLTVQGVTAQRERKKHFMHGHRRGKSHAVTPDELRGLHQPEIRGPSASVSSSQIQQVPRRSGHSGSKLAFQKLKHVRGTSSGSSSFIAGNLSPRVGVSQNQVQSGATQQSLSSSQGGPSLGAEAFLIDSASDSSSEGEMPAVTLSSSPHYRPTSGGRKISGDSEVDALKRQLAEQTRKRDESFILTQYVTYCTPAYSKNMPLSSWVLLRCLQEWDGFGPGGRDFREHLLEAFEQLARTAALDEARLMYWGAALVALQVLLETQMPALPRSEVARANARAVFQEHLSGLSGLIMQRLAATVLLALRPFVASALLEHGSLDAPPEDALAQLRPLITELDDLVSRAKGAKLPDPLLCCLLHRVAHGLAAIGLNTLLEKPGLCTFSNGLQMKGPLQELHSWLSRYASKAAAARLIPLQEAVNVLCMDKSALVEQEVRDEVCPHLTTSQLGQLLLLYTPDAFDSEPIHPRILAQLCGDDLRPDDYNMDPDLREVLAADLSEVSFDVMHVELPSSLTEEASLAFLDPAHSDNSAEKTDTW